MKSELKINLNKGFSKGVSVDIKVKTGIIFGIKKFIAYRVINLAVWIFNIAARIGFIKEVRVEIEIDKDKFFEKKNKKKKVKRIEE